MAPKHSDDTSLEPTKSELEILQVLWKYGSSTVRFVNEKINEEKRNVSYTATLKLMQIMFDKGLLIRDDSQMKHVYAAAHEENKTKNLLLKRFVNNLFEGSASKLMMQLLGNSKASKKELTAMKMLMDQFNKTNR